MKIEKSICVDMDIASIPIGNETVCFFIPTGSDGETKVSLISRENAEAIDEEKSILFAGKNLRVFGYDYKPFDYPSMEIGSGTFTIGKVKNKNEWVIAPF